MLFENVKFKIEYIEECIDNDANRSFIFTVDIKDFDTKYKKEYSIIKYAIFLFYD